jgi:hypothetical protein
MRLKHTSLAVALTVLFASVGYSRDLRMDQSQDPKTDQDRDTPRFRVQVYGDILADFTTRVSAYADLRSELEKGLPALTVTDDPAEMRRAVRGLAARIRVARAGAKRGDIFTRTISREFKKALLLAIDDSTWADIVDDNPGEFSKRINSSYPEKKPFSTVPPNVLAVLPRLPDDIEYRFLGRHLILLDTRASVIVDWIPYAIQCADIDDKTACHR